jgi:hypothetical protein
MRRRFVFGFLLIAALALGAIATPAGAATTRFLKGTVQGSTSANMGSPVTGVSDGTLLARHLGRGRYHFQFSGVFNGSTFDLSGPLTLTAADGSVLSGTLSGTAGNLSPFIGSTAPFDLVLTVTGGTRRFAAATGELHFTGTNTVTSIDFTNQTFTASTTGELAGLVTY